MGFYNAELHTIIVGREHGRKSRPGWRDRLHSELYHAVQCVRSWNPNSDVPSKSLNAHPGAIFNFDFSTDGSILAAACEKHSILLFDPLNGKMINSKTQAHSDCVNCVRFLDTRTFATCSDDTTVHMWDVRNMKMHVCALKGHTNWVKNIEYAPGAGLLTSGFDGSILLWDINSYTEGSTNHKQVFHTDGLMRSRLSKDTSKLVLSMADGTIMVVHDLDLHCLATDLEGFAPRKPQDHPAFYRPRNRVQIINDFPREDQAGMIASLEIHPQGWCIVSRNTTSDDESEWTCVHDIQEKSKAECSKSSVDKESASSSSSTEQKQSESTSQDSDSVPVDLSQISSHSDEASSSSSPSVASGLEAASTVATVGSPVPRPQRVVRRASRTMNARDQLTFLIRTGRNAADHSMFLVLGKNKPKQQRSCLLHYIQEPNVGRGYIKEVCFSSDGRLICSPFAFGVRLLAFNSDVSELCDCVPTQSTQLYEVTTNLSHADYVFTAKFSPTHCLMVTGCANGKVDFHQPVL